MVLCSCGNTQPVTTSRPDLPQPNAPESAPLHLVPFDWKVYNQDDLKRLLAQLPPGGRILLYTLDGDNYLAFDNDLTELQRYVQEQNRVIEFYKQLETNKATPIK